MRYPDDHKAQTRDKLLCSSSAIAKRGGFAATGVDGLMKAIGLSGGAFYSHFPSKNDLFSAIVERELSQSLARLADSLREADHTFAFAGGIDWDLSAALTALGDRACVHAALPDLIDDIVAKARPGDDVLIMSNGGFGGLHDRLLKALEHPRIGGTA